MVLSWVRRLFGGSSQNSASALEAVAAAVHASPHIAPRYPPADAGLHPLEASAVLAANGDLIDRLRLHAAVSDAHFKERFLDPLTRLAQHINVLPASSAALFSGEMGLFRAALETGFYSFQASDGRIFTGGEGVERRHALETRWRYLCFLAGMFHPLGKTLERVVVTDAHGRVWKRHFAGLTTWALEQDVERIFVSWGSSDADDAIGPGKASLALVPTVVGPMNLQMLQDGSADLVAALYELAAGDSGASRIAHQVVTGSWTRIERREAARRPQNFGRLTVGTHLGPYLVGAVRELVESGRWKVNASVLKVDRDGLYLQWPAAAADLIAFGVERSYGGWPADAPTLAALLKDSNVVEDRGGDLGLVEIVDDAGEILSGLKIANPLTVLDEFDPQEFARKPAKTLEGVLKADPLAATEAAAHRAAGLMAPASTAAAAPPAVPDRSLVTQGKAGDIEGQDQLQLLAASPADECGESAPPAPPAVGTPALPPAHAGKHKADSELDAGEPREKPGAKLREAPEVRYSDLVPEEIRDQIAAPLQVELLGKVIKAWRERGENSTTMRRIDNGAAIRFDYLTKHIMNVPTWVDTMARAGLVHVSAAERGVRVQKVPIPEGHPPVQAVVLSNLACRRLGL